MNGVLGEVRLFQLCENAEIFVDCLRALSALSPEWYKPLKDKRGWRLPEGSKSLADDICSSVIIQKQLAQKPREIFNEYRIGGLQDYLTLSCVERAIILADGKAIVYEDEDVCENKN